MSKKLSFKLFPNKELTTENRRYKYGTNIGETLDKRCHVTWNERLESKSANPSLTWIQLPKRDVINVGYMFDKPHLKLI